MFAFIAARLRTIDAHRLGVFGMLLGGAAIIVPPVTAFFALLSNPQYLVNLSHALTHLYWAIKLHRDLPDPDLLTIMQLVGASFAILGGFTVALICAYYGRPSDAHSSVPANPAGQSVRKE